MFLVYSSESRSAIAVRLSRVLWVAFPDTTTTDSSCLGIESVRPSAWCWCESLGDDSGLPMTETLCVIGGIGSTF